MQTLRLDQRQTSRQGKLLHRIGQWSQAAPGGSIGLRQNERDVVAGAGETRECNRGELGCAGEN
jgi:hypothetical protein